MITRTRRLGEVLCRRRRHRRVQAGLREMSCVAMVRITCPELFLPTMVAGKEKIMAQSRHATATHLLQAGVDISVIVLWLGQP